MRLLGCPELRQGGEHSVRQGEKSDVSSISLSAQSPSRTHLLERLGSLLQGVVYAKRVCMLLRVVVVRAWFAGV